MQSFAVDGHLMPARKAFSYSVRHVVRRRQMPHSVGVHEELDVLCVVVLVAADDIENHASESLLHLRLRQSQAPHHAEELFVRPRVGLVVVVMCYTA